MVRLGLIVYVALAGYVLLSPVTSAQEGVQATPPPAMVAPAEVSPTPEPTHTPTPEPTNTPTPEPTNTSTPKPTNTPTPEPTNTPTPTPTNTPTPKPDPTATPTTAPTKTPSPTATATPSPTVAPEAEVLFRDRDGTRDRDGADLGRIHIGGGRRVLPGAASVTVHSETRWSLFVSTSGPLTNLDTGDIIPLQRFQWRLSGESSWTPFRSGSMLVLGKQPPVPDGRKIVLDYSVIITRADAPGRYDTNVTYTVSAAP